MSDGYTINDLAATLALRFPGFMTDEGVNGADLVDAINELMGRHFEALRCEWSREHCPLCWSEEVEYVTTDGYGNERFKCTEGHTWAVTLEETPTNVTIDHDRDTEVIEADGSRSWMGKKK